MYQTARSILENKLKITEPDNKNYQYVLQLAAAEKPLAQIGSVHKDLLKMTGIKNEVFVADINWDEMFRLVPRYDIQYVPVPKFPSVRRDLALVVDKKVRFDDFKKLAFRTEKKLLQSVGIFDIYEGDKVPEGKKSWLQQVFEKELGAVLR